MDTSTRGVAYAWRALTRSSVVAAIALAGTVLVATPTIAAPPSNNAFTSAVELFTNSTSVTATNVEATLEASEPVPVCQATYGASVWFKWTAQSTGIVTLETAAFGTALDDTVLDVFSGPTIDALTSLGCDDDDGSGVHSLVRFGATQGVAYYIRVAGYSAETGEFELSLNAADCSSINRLYVDAFSEADVRDGLAWSSAHHRVQDALEAFQTCEESINEVWVASGTYVPSQVLDGDEQFQLAAGTHLLGGFAGDETLAGEADPANNRHRAVRRLAGRRYIRRH